MLNQHFTQITSFSPEISLQPELSITPVKLPDVEAYQLDPRLAHATTNIALVGYLIDATQDGR